MNEITVTINVIELFPSLRNGMFLNRPETRKLLKGLEQMDSEFPGLEIMRRQVRDILARRDWELITVSAHDAEFIKQYGVSIGIKQLKVTAPKTKLSPLQKWQRKNGLGRKR